MIKNKTYVHLGDEKLQRQREYDTHKDIQKQKEPSQHQQEPGTERIKYTQWHRQNTTGLQL